MYSSKYESLNTKVLFLAPRFFYSTQIAFRQQLQEHDKQPKVLTWPQMPIQSWIHGLREKYGQSRNFIIPLHLVPEHPPPVSWKSRAGLRYDVGAEGVFIKNLRVHRRSFANTTRENVKEFWHV